MQGSTPIVAAGKGLNFFYFLFLSRHQCNIESLVGGCTTKVAQALQLVLHHIKFITFRRLPEFWNALCRGMLVLARGQSRTLLGPFRAEDGPRLRIGLFLLLDLALLNPHPFARLCRIEWKGQILHRSYTAVASMSVPGGTYSGILEKDRRGHAGARSRDVRRLRCCFSDMNQGATVSS